MLPYRGEDNPFNDPHLDKVFVWKRKAKKLGWSKREAKQRAEELRVKNIPEIENAKRRRAQREEELAERLREREKKERERDSSSYAGWEAREEDFMLRQHQHASTIRINQGRERPIDTVARNVLLTKQLRFGPEIGPDGKATTMLGREVGIENASPLDMFAQLSPRELGQIREDLVKYRQLESSNGPFAAFWDALIVVCDDEMNHVDESSRRLPRVVRDTIRESCESKTVDEIHEELLDAQNKASQETMLQEDRLFYAELVATYRLEESRALVRRFHQSLVQTAKEHGRDVHQVKNRSQEEEVLPARVLTEEDEDDLDHIEAAFNAVVDLPLDGAAEGRTVKPKYWNRVKSGFDWNKYNRAHFDKDNPPPKSVLGYKFNIMYPGIKKTPMYKLERDPVDPENFCIIRFSASAPFLDIAFRIENREWDRSAHSGHKSTYENGVLQLHFNFVKRRYRR